MTTEAVEMFELGLGTPRAVSCATAETLIEDYDVVVVGGGLAGMMAGKVAAELGAIVVILEQHQQIGVPVRCAEGINKAGMDKFFPSLESVCSECIAKKIDGAHLIAPNGKKVFIAGEGYILNKSIFNQFLAIEAEEAEAQILTGAKVVGLKRDIDRIEITVVHDKKRYSFFGDVIIAADGPTSSTARWAGIGGKLNPADTIIGVQYLMKTREDSDFAEFYFGNEIAPKGYAWVFPKGDGMANVGLGITIEEQGFKQQNVNEYLNKFVKQKFPNASIVNRVHGIVPVGNYRRTHTVDGVIAVGDAGGFVDPATGGGNRFAMETGVIAGEVAVNAICDGDTSKKGLIEFEQRALRKIGKEISRNYKIRMMLESFSDDDFNVAANVLKRENLNDISLPFLMWKLSAALKKHPGLAMKIMSALV